MANKQALRELQQRLAQRMQAMAWASTPLGVPERWDPALHTLVPKEPDAIAAWAVFSWLIWSLVRPLA